MRTVARIVIVAFIMAMAMRLDAPAWAAFLGGMIIAYQVVPERQA